MPGKNGQNINGEQKNSKNRLDHAQRKMNFKATRAKKKQKFCVPNSGKYEHLKKELASFKKTSDAYIKFKNHKMAEEMARQNNEPNPVRGQNQGNLSKPEAEIKNENDLVIEEPKAEEKPQNIIEEKAKEDDAEMFNLDDIKVSEADLNNPALDDELAKLEQQIKKEEELKAKGIDPETVVNLDDSELDEDLKELMQDTDEKLEGAALDEEVQKLSNEVDGEVKNADNDELEVNDPLVDEELNHIENEIAEEAKLNPNPVAVNNEPKNVEKNQVNAESAKNDKKKNFFDMDDEEEELVEQEKNQPLRSNAQLDLNKYYKAQLNELFGEDDDEPIAEQEEPVNNEIANERRTISRADFPHIFVDDADDNLKNINMPEARRENPAENQINEVQVNEPQANEVQANEVQANEVQINNQIKNNNSSKQNIPQSNAERLELLRKQVMAGRDEEDEIDEDELEEDDAYVQHLMDGIKANMPSKNSPNARYYQPEEPVEQQNIPQEAQENPFQGQNFAINNNPPKQNIPQSRAEKMELLRKQVMAGRDEEEVDEDEIAEAEEAENAEAARIMASIKANSPQKKEVNAPKDSLFPAAHFDEIPKTGRIDPAFFIDDDDEEIELNANPNVNNQQNVAQNQKENEPQAANNNDTKEKADAKPEQNIKPVNSEARVAVYTEKLKAYNNMYKLNIDSNKFASSVIEAWNLMTSGDKQKMADGQKVINNIFKDTLKNAFDIEKGVAYDEHRLPEYAEIIKSTNDLLRSAMYGFTDMYHNPNRTELFAATAFGGLDEKDIVSLTTGQSSWSMDQKSDEAWNIQSKEAKNIAAQWLKEEKPYEKMISEMNTLVKDNKNGNLDLQAAYNKLTAAEWLLTNNEKMMVEDPNDPYNPIPNWGNRYWKTLTTTREALGIPKHTSMRDLIQLDYAESAKAVENSAYNEKQIYDGVLDPADRAMHDSLDIQKEEFATLSAAVNLTEPQNERKADEIEMNADRVPYPVKELDEKLIMKNQPKDYNFVVERTAEVKLNGPNQA